MNTTLQRILSKPKLWLSALGAGLLVTTASSWLQGPEGLAAGTWVVEREDLGDYLRDHWSAPRFTGILVPAAQVLGEGGIEIELERGGDYRVTSHFETSVLGHKLGPVLTIAEVGHWSLVDASMGGGTIRFAPERYDLLAPKDRDSQDLFRRAASLAPSVREFGWETVDADTLLWRPTGASSNTAPIRVRRR